MTKRRNLDGCYFRFGTENICFSDMTYEQRDEVTKDWSAQWWRTLANHLADCLREVGDEFDIERGYEE